MGNSLPILIFSGDENICYGILDSFSRQLRDALVSMGESVVFFDAKRDDIRDCLGKEYRAVIGFMETFFYNRVPNGDRLLFDLIIGPKFNYWPDHPAFYNRFKNDFPGDYHILTQDRNYVRFINKYYPKATAHFLPPGGMISESIIPFEEREYDLSFLGTYVDYRDVLRTFNASDEATKIITNTYLDYMIKHPDETTEDAFANTLSSLGASVTQEQFLSELCKIHRIATMGAARYYKEKVIESILNNGIVIDVFGDSWKKSPFAENDNLRIHQEVPATSVRDVYNNSRMSLNIMTWHKDCITERILDAMLAGSVVLTDRTQALAESFEDKKDILYFDLNKIETVSEIIRTGLEHPEIASCGHDKAMLGHTWKDRAVALLEIIDKKGD